MGDKRVSTEVILESYKRLGSVWSVAKEVGLCGQSVHERLVKAGANKSINKFTDEDLGRLAVIYDEYVNAGRLDELAAIFGRTKQFICRQARRVRLTNLRRTGIADSASISRRVKEWYKHNPHPKGMLGKSHSSETKAIISRSSASRWKNMSKQEKVAMVEKSMKGRIASSGKLVHHVKRGSWKASWEEIGGKRNFFRSGWEANYARYLEWQKSNGLIQEWEHEPETFWFKDIQRGTRSYLPDFRVTNNDGSQSFHEVKGWMDSASKTKLRRMKKYHPNVKMILIDGKAYNSIKKKLSSIVPGWK